MISSWVWAISIGAAVSGIFLSVALKVPVVTAWWAPGTALLVILFLIGISGSFDRLLKHMPKGIAAGMMAGILFQFGVQAFRAAGSAPLLGFGMIGAITANIMGAIIGLVAYLVLHREWRVKSA